jgi:L-lactate dehydrogenase complex protein LldF
MGVEKDPWLPFASSLCGACAEVCPVKIDIPKILLTLRQEVTESRTRDGSNRSERTAFRMWAWVMRHPRLYENLAAMGSGMARAFPSLVAVGPLKAWLSQRDLPPTPKHSFRDLWKHRNGAVTKGSGS